MRLLFSQRPTTTRLAMLSSGRMAARPATSSMCNSCRLQYLSQRRALVTTSSRRAGADAPRPSSMPRRTSSNPLSNIMRPEKPSTPSSTAAPSSYIGDLFSGAKAEAATRPGASLSSEEPHHLHVYAHKHNIHITFTEPSRNPIFSVSCGNIGLKKSQRATFEAAYQLSTYAMRKMTEIKWRAGGKKMTTNPLRTLKDIGARGATGGGIEVILRGYGPGREAFQKALMGTEGTIFKPLVVRVTDATRLKFGGTRSPEVRRLG